MEEEKTAVLPEETVPEGAQGETTPAAAEEGGDPAFLAASAEEFFRRYPQVDIVRLERDPAFRRFCGSRLYREPLADLYGDYLAVAEETRRREGARREDRARRSTGSGAGSAAGGLTGEQRRALEEWNRAYPHMRMTAREFLER